MKQLIFLFLILTSCTVYRVNVVRPYNPNCVAVKAIGTDWIGFTTKEVVTSNLLRAVKEVQGVDAVVKPKDTRYQFVIKIASQAFDSLTVLNNVKRISCANEDTLRSGK